MLDAPIGPEERARIEALRALGVLDTEAEERFDRITRLARRLFGVPIALVSLVDADRQWFKSRQGLEAPETPRNVSFCGHAITGDEAMVVPDAHSDERFADNPLVTGDPHVRFYAGYPLSAPGGEKIGTLCVIDHEPRKPEADDLEALRDLASMVEQALAALSLATTDALTGLSNRRGFESLAQYVLAHAQRTGQPFTLLFFDLDGFKQINDQLGHAEGDRALCAFARLLLDVFRETDVIARLGGDEFCVLMSGLDEAQARAPLARLEATLRERADGCPLHARLAWSVGAVTHAPPDLPTLAELLARADERMYQAKRAGRLRA